MAAHPGMRAARRDVPSPPDRQIAIVGGGIAGMAAAAAFGRAGLRVTVHEQAPEIAEIGAGLQISPNGAAVLAGLGLTADCEARAIRARAVQPMDALSGRVIGTFDLTRLAGHPYRFFHRADLLDLLAEAAARAGAVVQTDARVSAVTADGQMTFASGERSRPDLAVAADGLHSVLRPVLNPETRAFFTGQTAWRAVVPGDHPPIARIWMAPGRHVVTYPLTGGRINIVAVRETADWADEGWHHPDDPKALATAFADCSADLRALVARVTEVRLWGLFLHPVAAHWHGSAAALIGDAAHPTLPFLGQGANLAMEDAWTLAALTARAGALAPDLAPDQTGDQAGDLAAALARYQALRHARVSRAIAAANANATNYHLSGARRAAAHLGLRGLARLAPGAFLGRLDWLYRHDVTQALPLVARPD